MTSPSQRSIPWHRLWRGFVALFGLDRCPVPPRIESPAGRTRRRRLEQVFQGRLDGRG